MYILPPLTLSYNTTIIFPLLTTSLEVAWPTSQVTTLKNGDVSTSTGYDRITETTTLTIPPITTDRIDLWTVNISCGVSSSLISITSSILPPPFTITDDRNPWSQQGVTHPLRTLTVTPPPYPYSTTSPGPQQHPPIAHRSGTPGKYCKIGCGHKCSGLFCHRPCLFDCIPGPGLGFFDPDDPDPEGPPSPDPERSPEPSSSSTSCSKSIVIDYWVSCTTLSSDSSSCTTTNSSLVTGCDVTASATTSGAGSCPTLDADDEEGEDAGRNADANSVSSTTASATITPPPSISSPAPTSTPSCFLQDEDPDRGIYSAYCVCEGSLESPETSSTGSCSFTALPSQTINPTSSPSVVTSNCQICTIMDVNNGECSTIAGCVPTGLSTAPPNPTSPTPPPAPPQIPNIGYFDPCESDGGAEEGAGASCTSYWTVFTDAEGVTYNPCKDQAIYSDTKSEISGNDIKYPVSAGPFDGGGLTGCLCSLSSSKDGGSMTCDGAVGTCMKDASGFSDYDGGNDAWRPASVCTFTFNQWSGK